MAKNAENPPASADRLFTALSGVTRSLNLANTVTAAAYQALRGKI